ncbi:glutamate racemase [Candidatus Termititenax spirochaetophilus]|uniref:Glutamate racemase n=1 Tax=Candidatus Termititenax spirochaetophilus TaxID=2218522 RepID=A0A388T9W8_9BACT|nr:glutamate racemase [Candidatus Termititenax spirochaetophilus]
MNNQPIGIFDSGVGGLTVLREVQKQLPRESVIYYGDLARLPYGTKTPDEIIAINDDIVEYLVSRGVKMIIVACNTSSAVALEHSKGKFAIPIIGVIGPGANTALAVTQNKKIGVIATEATVKAHAYKNILNSLNPSVEVYEQSCPQFVPLIEKGDLNSAELRQAVREYLEPLLQTDVDTLIYGCTHYPLIDGLIRQYAGNKLKYVNPAVGTVNLAGEILERENLLADTEPQLEFVASEYKGGKYVRIDGRELLLRSAPAYQE